MLGSLLSSTIKAVTLPLDAASAGFDLLVGGDGSKRSRTRDRDEMPNLLGGIERLRDRVAEAAKEIDE